MAGTDVPQARGYRSLAGQQLLAAQKANAAPLSRRRVELKRLQLPYFNSLQLPAANPHRHLVRAVLSACIAYLVDVGALATHPDVIGVEPGDVRHSSNQHAV